MKERERERERGYYLWRWRAMQGWVRNQTTMETFDNCTIYFYEWEEMENAKGRGKIHNIDELSGVEAKRGRNKLRASPIALDKSKIISIVENETQKMVSNGFSISWFLFWLMNSSSSNLMGYCTLAKE